jgi:uncharacterized protein YqgV (UPF0045/DUF77 family)
MIVQVEASLYPLGTPEIGKSIEMFIGRLSRPGLNIVRGNMSTQIEGDMHEVFPALSEAFESVASSSAVVLSIKISNACPIPVNPKKTPESPDGGVTCHD